MDSQLAELIRKYKSTPDLDNGLRSAKQLLRAGRKEDAFRFLDTVYMHHLHTLPGAVAEVSPEYHADITETGIYHGEGLVRREQRALEAIGERINSRPIVVIKEHHVNYLTLARKGLQQIPEGLTQLLCLQDLNLNANPLATIQGLPNLPQLQHIRLSRTSLKTLQDLPQLQSIELYWTEIPQQEIDELREKGIDILTNNL